MQIVWLLFIKEFLQSVPLNDFVLNDLFSNNYLKLSLWIAWKIAFDNYTYG